MVTLTRRSVCALDCPDTCSLLVDIDTADRAKRLRGDPDHPITRGFLCAKVAKYLDHQYHPQRLLRPLRRTGPKGTGDFVPIGWEEAIGEIAARLTRISSQYGPEAILPYSYAGTMGLLNGSGMDRRFFHRLGASRLDRTICSAAGGTALTLSQGAKIGADPRHFAHSKLIIAWGANILGTNVHLWPFIVEARRKGAKLIVIDPVRNRTGSVADQHLFINPGADLALALGLIHIILRERWQDGSYIQNHTEGFEDLESLASSYTPHLVAGLTGLTAVEIEALARDYATYRPAMIRLNYGVQRGQNGGNAVRAISALPVLTGAWRELGGGMQLTTSGAFEFNRLALERPDLQLSSPLGREARMINMSRLGSALTTLEDPPVQALVVYNSNPATIAPDQNQVLSGLRRPDLFTVVIDHLLTDTAEYADIVLPATTFLEHTDLYLAYGHYYLQYADPALPPPPQAKSNVEVFRLLALQMGFTEPCFGDNNDQMIAALLESQSPYLKGITLERLKRERSVLLNLGPGEQPFLPFRDGAFPTPSGKFQFGAGTLTYTPPVESRFGEAGLVRRYPFELISPKNDNSMNSTFGERDDVDQETAVLEMHLEDALTRGISSGDCVRVFNDRGSCTFRLRTSSAVKPGVLAARTMRWHRNSHSRTGVNVLTSQLLTDLGSGPTFYNCLVDVERAEHA